MFRCYVLLNHSPVSVTLSSEYFFVVVMNIYKGRLYLLLTWAQMYQRVGRGVFLLRISLTLGLQHRCCWLGWIPLGLCVGISLPFNQNHIIPLKSNHLYT